jgi:hypothetical protein
MRQTIRANARSQVGMRVPPNRDEGALAAGGPVATTANGVLPGMIETEVTAPSVSSTPTTTPNGRRGSRFIRSDCSRTKDRKASSRASFLHVKTIPTSREDLGEADFRRNRDRTRYSKRVLVVGSGVIEAGLAHASKSSGTHWNVRVADAVLVLGCRRRHNPFEDSWAVRRAAQSHS